MPLVSPEIIGTAPNVSHLRKVSKEVVPIYYDDLHKEKILIVDDSEMNRSILADMLGDEYEIIEAENGVQAVAILKKQAAEISLILLDMVMPGMDGFEVLNAMKQNLWIEDIPVIMISAESGSAYVQQAYEMGVTDFIARPFDASIVHRRVVNTLFLYAKQKKLIELVAEQIHEKERYSNLMVDILSHIVEFRNGESGLHILHVRTLTEMLLKRLMEKTDRYQISQSDVTLIITASVLHDIGKIAVDENILNKPGRLTSEEFEIMKTHSMIGAKMLRELPIHQGEPLLKTAYDICRWHHERYDGRGYPDGLSGDEIPISAQIVSMADVYDALTSKRVYKEAYSHETAIRMIREGQCGAFNPLLLECLNEIADSLEKTMDYERMKYDFFVDVDEEIPFEYIVSPPTLTLSSYGANKLGLEETIVNPCCSQGILNVMGADAWSDISRALRESTPEQPIVSYECELRYQGQSQRYRITMRAVWSDSEPPEYTGCIGKAVEQ